MKSALVFFVLIVSLSPAMAQTTGAPTPGDAQLRAAIAVLTYEKSAAEDRAMQAIMQLEAVTRERDALKASASQAAPKDDKK